VVLGHNQNGHGIGNSYGVNLTVKGFYENHYENHFKKLMFY
jgi:hypothetical protein